MATADLCDAGDAGKVSVTPISLCELYVKAIGRAAEVEKFEESGDSGESFLEWARRLV